MMARHARAVITYVAVCVLFLSLGYVAHFALPGAATPVALAQPQYDDEGYWDRDGRDGRDDRRVRDIQVVARGGRVGGNDIGEVVVNGTVVMRLGWSSGTQGIERARTVARRIRDAISSGASSGSFSADRSGGNWVVRTRWGMIATVDTQDTRISGNSRQVTVQRWASNINSALRVYDDENGGSYPGDGYPNEGDGRIQVSAQSGRVGGEEVGDVLMNGAIVVRLGWSSTRDAAGRARTVAQRIRDALNNGARRGDFNAAQSNGTWVVRTRWGIIATVGEQDARIAGTTRQATARRWASNINDALRGYGGGTGGGNDDGWNPDERYDDKWVPIISILRGVRVGAARVAGPASRVRLVQAVGQLETDFRDLVDIEVYVPISTEVPGRSIDRVQGVAVTGLADVRL